MIHTHKNFHKVILAGSLVACIGGYVNGLAIIEFAHTVSHMTGNISKLGISLVDGEMKTVFFLLGLLFSFMGGACTAAIVVGNAKFKLGRRYGAVLSLEGFLLLVAVVLEWFPSLDIVSQYVLAFACGVQNAMCTNYSGAVVRTTHLTGIVTDIAMVTGFWLKYHKSHPQSIEVWKLKILIPLAVSFVTGSGLGAVAYKLMARIALLVPATLLVVVSTIYIIKTHKEALALYELEKLRAQRYKEAEAHLNASRKSSRNPSRIHSRRGSRIHSRAPSPSLSRIASMEFQQLPSFDSIHHLHHPLNIASTPASPVSSSTPSSITLTHENDHHLLYNNPTHDSNGNNESTSETATIIGHSNPTSPDLGLQNVHYNTEDPALPHHHDNTHHPEPAAIAERLEDEDIFDTSDEETDTSDEERELDDLENYVEGSSTPDGAGGGAIIV